MSALSLLFRDTLRRDRVRLACALLGITAAAALLTWTLGLAATTWWQGRALSESMGRPFDCWVATGRASAAAPKGSGMQTLAHGSPIKMIPAAVTDAVKASPDIESLVTTTVFRCRLDWRPQGRPLQGAGVGGGIAPVRDFPTCPYPDGLAAGRWPEAAAAEPEFVISPRAFGADGLKDAPPIGTRLPVVTPGGQVMATLCGYLAETIRPVGGFPTMFASDNLADAAALADAEGLCNLILIRLKPFRAPDALRELVRTISPDDDAATLTTRTDLLRQLRSDAIQSLARQVPLLVVLACVATLCMLINALCIGLEQNRLQHIRLRALGMTLPQLAQLVIREGVFLAGLGGGLGFILGGSLLAAFVRAKPLLFPDGLHLGWITPLGVAGLLLLSAALALILPLRRVARLRPFESRAAATRWQSPHPIRALVLALLQTLPVLLTLVLFPSKPILRSAWFLLVGLPLAIRGLLHLAPPLLWLTEHTLARPLGWLLNLRPELLRGCLTRATGRNARMALTLTAGLGAYFAIHIWGASLTEPFIPTRTLPDAVVSILPGGLPLGTDLGELPTNARGEAPRLTPFFSAQYRLHDEDFAAIETRTGAQPKQNNILLIGTPGETGVTVTAMFARQTGLRIGDTLRIQRKDRAGAVTTLPLTITAIRQINWHLYTARARLRGRNGAPFGTLGPIFVGAEVVQAFDPETASRHCFYWAQLPSNAASDPQALYSLSDKLELALQSLANTSDREAWKVGGLEGWSPRKQDASDVSAAAPRGRPNQTSKRPNLQPSNVIVHLRDEISDGTLAHSAELLGDLARIPLWSLLILCTGFIALLAATVCLQADELRTLHAIGMTRAQLGRFLCAQALLLGVTAAELALLFGLTVGWGFTGWTLAWMPFGGLPTALCLPPLPILQGLGVLFAAILILTPLPVFFLVRRLLKR